MVVDSIGNKVYNKFGIVFKLGACSVLLQYWKLLFSFGFNIVGYVWLYESRCISRTDSKVKIWLMKSLFLTIGLEVANYGEDIFIDMMNFLKGSRR